MGLTEAEIDKKFRELITLLNNQSPDRLEALKHLLEKEIQHETTETGSKITKKQGAEGQDGPDNR
jgi:hypothetical protein